MASPSWPAKRMKGWFVALNPLSLKRSPKSLLHKPPDELEPRAV